MKNILIIGALLFTTVLLSQGSGVIKGTVTDKAMNNEPLLFANVQLKGSDTSNQTNFHGNFEISNIESGAYTLIISYAGYETEEVDMIVIENETTTIKTSLALMEVDFDEVLGMNTISKKE